MFIFFIEYFGFFDDKNISVIVLFSALDDLVFMNILCLVKWLIKLLVEEDFLQLRWLLKIRFVPQMLQLAYSPSDGSHVTGKHNLEFDLYIWKYVHAFDLVPLLDVNGIKSYTVDVSGWGLFWYWMKSLLDSDVLEDVL